MYSDEESKCSIIEILSLYMYLQLYTFIELNFAKKKLNKGLTKLLSYLSWISTKYQF